jgi:hypothetical protein
MVRSVAKIAMVVVALGILAPLPSCDGKPMCKVCQRPECGNLTFTIHLRDGSKVQNCCARCGLHYVATERPDVASMSVRDFDTASPLDARAAIYVDGSDVTPCSSMHASKNPPQDERGCCMKQVYDRCLPSLLAFGSRGRAEAFSRNHGGAVKTFAEIDRGGPSRG